MTFYAFTLVWSGSPMIQLLELHFQYTAAASKSDSPDRAVTAFGFGATEVVTIEAFIFVAFQI